MSGHEEASLSPTDFSPFLAIIDRASVAGGTAARRSPLQTGTCFVPARRMSKLPDGRIGDGGQARTGDVSDGGAEEAALAPLLFVVRQRRRPQSNHARRKGQSGFATIIISLESIPTEETKREDGRSERK